MIRLFLTVDDVAAVMAAGYTHIRIYTDITEGGDFTTLDGNVALVAGEPSYEYTDRGGTDATWYKSVYYGAVPGEGTKSTARRGDTRSSYATVEELREEIDKTSNTADLTLVRLLDAASRNIDRACGVEDGGFIADLSANARVYTGRGKPWLRIDPCTQITLVAAKESLTSSTYTSWASTDWIEFSGDAENPDFNSTPYDAIMVDITGDYTVFLSGLATVVAGFRFKPTTQEKRGIPTVQVTARWGLADTVPDDIRFATLFQAARWHKRLQAGGSDTLASGELGTLMYTKTLDPAVRRILIDGRWTEVSL
jgi:hypothetical protein